MCLLGLFLSTVLHLPEWKKLLDLLSREEIVWGRGWSYCCLPIFAPLPLDPKVIRYSQVERTTSQNIFIECMELLGQVRLVGVLDHVRETRPHLATADSVRTAWHWSWHYAARKPGFFTCSSATGLMPPPWLCSCSKDSFIWKVTSPLKRPFTRWLETEQIIGQNGHMKYKKNYRQIAISNEGLA